MDSARKLCEAVAQSVEQLKEGYRVRTEGDYCVVVTPFTGPEFSPIEVVAERGEVTGTLVLSDGGYIADHFFMHGRELEDDPDLLDHVSALASRTGVSVLEEALVIEADRRSLQTGLAALIQAMLSIPELWDRPEKRVHRPSFRAQVGHEFARMDLPLAEAVAIRGKYDAHQFDFAAQTNGRTVAVQCLSATRRARAAELKRMIAWDLIDVRETGIDLDATVVVDDTTRPRQAATGEAVIAALRPMTSRLLFWRSLEASAFAPLRDLSALLVDST